MASPGIPDPTTTAHPAAGTDLAATAADAPPCARQDEQALTAPTRPVRRVPPGDPADGPAAGDRTGEDAAEEAR